MPVLTFGFKVVNINVKLSISKYFDEVSKKIDHNCNSNLEEKARKPRILVQEVIHAMMFLKMDLNLKEGGGGGMKGQKMVQNDEKLCLWCSIAQEPYII